MTATGSEISAEIGRLRVAAQVRGHEMACWLDDGRLQGDSELVTRVRRMVGDRPIGPFELAQLVRDAVGSEVSIGFGAE